MTDRPLSHLRVLDLSRLPPGGFGTGMLADLGADVLRIEPPKGGDPLRMIPGAASAYHRGKRAMTLDLKHQRAGEILRRLVSGVDVVVESGLPAALREQGFGYEELAAEQPGVIWCSISGFGRDSPYADRAAHDITFLGYSGLLGLMAGDAIPPTPDFVLAVPFGALVGVVGILSALAARDRSGEGSYVDPSIPAAATWVIGEPVARVAAGGQAGWGQAANRRAYRAADGRLITVAAAEPRTWGALCEALGRPDLVDQLAAPPERQGGLAQGLAPIFAPRTAAEWVEQLPPAAAVGPVNEVEELLDDPHTRARGSMIEVDDAGTPALRTPVRLRASDGTEVPFEPGPPPAAGEHTDAALAAAGYAPDEIAALRDAGAV